VEHRFLAQPISHLIIPDPHAHPNYSNERFKALGRLIAELQPTTIICLGDFADMPSLSSYDKGKKSFEGRRFKKDLEAVRDAQEKMFGQVAKRAPKYQPIWHMCLGNHEDRILRAVNDNAELEGTIGIESLEYDKFGWTVHPFLEPLILDGIGYQHYWATGVSGRPISGENVAKALCNKLHISAVAGHSHVLDHAERTRADKQKIFGLSAGCYVSPDYVEGWNMATAAMWWRGVIYLGDLDGRGYYDEMRQITLRKILRDFA